MASISFAAKPPVTKPAAAETTTVEVEATPVAAPTPETPRDKEGVSTAVAVIEPKPLAVPSHGPQVAEGVEGEVAMSDIRLPRINLVQKVGKLCDEFAPGSILFEKQVVLTDGKTPFDLTPLRIRKMYQRKVEWGSAAADEAPETYNTREEVLAAGGSTEWGDENFFSELAHVQCAVKLPENAEGDEVIDLFPYQLGESFYAVAMWTVSSSGYTAVAKPLFTAAAGLLRNGLYHGHYNVTTEVRKNEKNSWYAPRLVFAGKHTADAAEFFKTIAGL